MNLTTCYINYKHLNSFVTLLLYSLFNIAWFTSTKEENFEKGSEEVLSMLPRMLGSVPLTLSLLIILFLSIILSTVNIINLSNLQEQYLQVFQNNNFQGGSGKTIKTAKYVVYSKKPDGAFLQHVFNGFRR